MCANDAAMCAKDAAMCAKDAAMCAEVASACAKVLNVRHNDAKTMQKPCENHAVVRRGRVSDGGITAHHRCVFS